MAVWVSGWAIAVLIHLGACTSITTLNVGDCQFTIVEDGPPLTLHWETVAKCGNLLEIKVVFNEGS